MSNTPTTILLRTFPPGAESTRSRKSAAGPKYGSMVVPGESHRQKPCNPRLLSKGDGNGNVKRKW